MGARRQDRSTTGRQPSGKSGSAAVKLATRLAMVLLRRPRWAPAGLLAASWLVVFGLPHPAPAQPFDQASSAALTTACRNFLDGNAKLSSNMQHLCGIINSPTGVVSTAPATPEVAAGAGPVIERRLQALRPSKEKMQEEAEATEVVYASYTGDAVLAADNGQLQLPSAGGAPRRSWSARHPG